MPLVRISLLRGRGESFGRKVGDPECLDIERSEGFIAIQITLSEGRSVETKKAFYQRVAESLRRDLDVRPQDVFINLVEVKKENWSFGNGIAQYVT
jgi:phenylpyruvate tautomerase PptA (4-oxalocrotonate tautomerase family)